MRNLSSDALAKIANNVGNEPINIIEIEWVKDSNARSTYAERELQGIIPGNILSISTLDNVINIMLGSDSQEIEIILDDADGEIKNIMDNNDIHKRDVWVYQWFEGLDLDDKFLLFRGKINSPVIWSESDRTVSFTVISQLEDREIGFSPEEGEFSEISPELIGEPWPMCFGTVLHSKTVKLTSEVNGTLGDGFGIADFALPHRASALDVIWDYKYNCEANEVNTIGKAMCSIVKYNGRADPIYQQALQLRADYRCQVQTQRAQFRVLNGEYFPRGTITLKIGEAKLLGHFIGNSNIFRLAYNISNIYGLGDYHKNHPKYHQFITYGRFIFGSRTSVEQTNRGSPYTLDCITDETEKQKKLHLPYPEVIGHHYIAYFGLHFNMYSGKVVGDNAGYVFLKAGSRVELADNEEQKFVVSIVPGQVLKVTAWAQREGQRFLQDVPKDYYTVSTETYGTVSAVIVTLKEALSKYEGMGWEDDIYVTFKSDVGPNTVDILQYLIEQYSDFNIDTTSFATVKSQIDNYPSHFAIYDRKNILTVLQEIAWQACCLLYLKDDKFYIRYLPAEPTGVDNIGRKDIETQTLELHHTRTEDIVTKMVCTWKGSQVQEEPFRTILRHNVAKYGTQEENYNFYIYNYVDVIIKNATFWLIRLSNTWKKALFKTALTKLNLETLDPINLELIDILANQTVVAEIEQANYDSESRSLAFECWTPVKAGEMEPYIFAYPANVDSVETFPTDFEIQNNFDGSGFSKNQGSAGALPITLNARVITVNMASDKKDPYNEKKKDEETGEEIDRRYNDRGNPTPSNIGDVKPEFVYPEEEFLEEGERGPESKTFTGDPLFQPDGYGNNYPGGPGSGLTNDDISDPGGGTGNNDPNNLPTPDELEDNDCLFYVSVWYADPVNQVRKSDGQLSGWNECDVTGKLVNGQLTSAEDREVYVFNSCTAARNFADAMQSYIDSEATVCKAHPFMVLGEPDQCPVQGKEDCQEPSLPQMVAFKPSGGPSGSGWGNFSTWASENWVLDGLTYV